MKKAVFVLLLLLLCTVFYTVPRIQEIAAGVAIVLFGMIFLQDGFKKFSGGPLENMLRKSTDNIFKSISFGIVSTSVLQASSLVALMSISFIGAGIIDLASGIGIIFGANIGTTSGAWLISFFGLKLNISSFALPLIVFGVILVLQSNTKIKGAGYVLAGIGFLFLGIHYMKTGFEAYQQNFDLKQFSMTGFWGLLFFTLIGITATVLMQSSHASLALILAALSTGQITYENSLAMAIGANIGTTVTAIIGSISSGIGGRRLAGAHLVFNLITGILAMLLIGEFRWIVDRISEVVGIASGDYLFKLSMFHTLFNIVGVLIMLPLIPLLVRILESVIKTGEDDDIAKPKYLSKAVLKYPESAIPAFIKESRHLFDNAFEIIAHGINIHRDDILSDIKLKEIVKNSTEIIHIDIDDVYYRKIKLIYSKIIKYATLIQSYQLSEGDVSIINQVRIANRYMIEIIKHLRNIQDNISTYCLSDNPDIKNEYNILRLKIAKVMREIYRTQNVENIKEQNSKLLKLQAKARQHDVLVNGRLDELIRNRKISSSMATSLINDSALVARICERLITIAELLYIKTDTLLDYVPDVEDGDSSDFFEENTL